MMRWMISALVVLGTLGAAEAAPVVNLSAPIAIPRAGEVTLTDDPRVVWGVVASGTPTLLVITTSTCPSCVTQKAIIRQWAPTQPQLAILVINAEEAMDIAVRHQVTTVPTLAWYQGGVLRGLSGGLGLSPLVAWAERMGSAPTTPKQGP
jgi:hypothetical protein